MPPTKRTIFVVFDVNEMPKGYKKWKYWKLTWKEVKWSDKKVQKKKRNEKKSHHKKSGLWKVEKKRQHTSIGVSLVDEVFFCFHLLVFGFSLFNFGSLGALG